MMMMMMMEFTEYQQSHASTRRPQAATTNGHVYAPFNNEEAISKGSIVVVIIKE